MIKLNNKNITYVAFADSANSIKAPKEIWYADSNNSVKLVYRRKDALIEGEDYEKYHWLVGGGSTRIKVIGNIYRDTFSVVTIPTTTTSKRLLTSMGTTYDGNTQEYQIMVGEASEFTIRHGIRINNRPTAILKEFTDNYINNEYEITTYRDGDYYYGNINGVEYKNNRNFGEYQFADEDIVINIYSNGFKLGNFNSGRVNLTPCKLLKPVPKWLDANGIRRQVGECGMIDLISGKFYGNVDSVGTFTVENYYERK